jgi:REP element-mobilizing transposase RayT
LSAATPPVYESAIEPHPEGMLAIQTIRRQPMSSTYLSLHYHIVFGTKDRVPLIHAGWRLRLHEYLGGTIRGLGGFPEGVGGVADHVHLLIGLKATHCLADFMRELKKAASVWIHNEIKLDSFAWQEATPPSP